MNTPLNIACDIIYRLRGASLENWNGQAADLAIRRLCETGKHVDDLTVGEVRGILSAAAAEYTAERRAALLWLHNWRAEKPLRGDAVGGGE